MSAGEHEKMRQAQVADERKRETVSEREGEQQFWHVCKIILARLFWSGKSETRSPAANHSNRYHAFNVFFLLFFFLILCLCLLLFGFSVFLLSFAFPGVWGCVIGCMFVYCAGCSLLILCVSLYLSFTWDSAFFQPLQWDFRSTAHRANDLVSAFKIIFIQTIAEFVVNSIPFAFHYIGFSSIQFNSNILLRHLPSI